MTIDAASANAALAGAVERYWGYSTFRPLQREAMEAILADRDSLVVLPTGGGKSLCFQAPALVREGLAIVVSPLISLMKDQVDTLVGNGVSAAFLNSSLSSDARSTITSGVRDGKYRLLYVSPERLVGEGGDGFQSWLSRCNVSFIAVDEAHCVSQWGHDFRPDYLNIGEARERLGAPPCVALTATATPRVQDDIAEVLGLRDAARIVTGFNRPNLLFSVRSTPTAKEKKNALAAFLHEREGQPGLVYVSTRKEADAIARFIREHAGREARTYHAGLPDAERTEVQERFL
ncbi:MAG: RecQ family ATP-dependent DNA helicase, partial [Acidobacteriota bacterium]|nr:RecQ family ATP-dependent DNA helicase [Acidobacteriota bacterium]